MIASTQRLTPAKPSASAANSSTPRRRILLVEDHPVVSSGLSELINYESDFEVCGVADDYGSALQKIDSMKPDLVVLDLTLKGRGGLDLLKDIKAQHPKMLVIVLSMHDENLYGPRALRAGAAGYVMKQEATETLFCAIRQVLGGGNYVSPSMEKKLMQRFFQPGRNAALDPLERLSDRELEVFRLIGEGKGTVEIAKRLCLSPKTIESHRAHIKEKLNLKDGAELVRHAIAMHGEAGIPQPTAASVGTAPA